MVLTPEDMLEYQKLEAALEVERQKSTQHFRDYSQLSSFSQTVPQNLIQWQLDLTAEMEMIQHFLKSERIVRDEKGNEFWTAPRDPAMRTLTDHGVERIMEVITFIVNKNIILSNFDETQIKNNLLDLGRELNNTLYYNYESFFYKPSVEELVNRDLEFIKESEARIRIKIPTKSVHLTDELQEKMDMTLRKKIDEIRNRKIEDYQKEAEHAYDNNINKYPLIFHIVLKAIQGAYQRAWRGGERSSLHTARHVSETITPQGYGVSGMRVAAPIQQQKSSWFKPWTWTSR